MDSTPSSSHTLLKTILIALVVILIVGTFGYGAYRYNLLRLQNIALGNTLTLLESNISELQSRNSELTLTIDTTQKQFDSLTGQISGISSTVGTLKKLAETDSELLKKYSKIYFLNENYVPVSLTPIDTGSLFEKTKNTSFITPAFPHLSNLFDAANSDGQHLLIVSAYRSFSNQAGLKTTYKMTYGTGANKFSADQGYSEHQLGTAVDFTTVKIGASFVSFSKTLEYRWLLDHGFEYGFVESYPENNRYYVFEPWHWRFVGVALAKKLHDENKHFYELDQREIDSYLVHLFD